MPRTAYASERYQYLCDLRTYRAMTRVNNIDTKHARRATQRLLAGIRKHREKHS